MTFCPTMMDNKFEDPSFRRRERKQRHCQRVGLQDVSNDIEIVEVASLIKNPLLEHNGQNGIGKITSIREVISSRPCQRRKSYSKYDKYISKILKSEQEFEVQINDLAFDLEHFNECRNSGTCKRGENDQSKTSEKDKNTYIKNTCISDPFQSAASENRSWKIEERRQSIQQKLYDCTEYLLTESEEEDIHERAELYAVTMNPDESFYMLHDLSRPTFFFGDPNHGLSDNINFYSLMPKKRKRRSYNNIDCYVTHHNKEDLYDNTHMLPKGTKLLKPPNKLVELVAQAIDSSPDELLQVQQIYTVLQNKYPYFRYMDKASISSWRSSIRHALYQKWFRKIRFNTESIHTKGCYWSINRHYSPKEWTMPGIPDDDDETLPLPAEEKDCCLDQVFNSNAGPPTSLLDDKGQGHLDENDMQDLFPVSIHGPFFTLPCDMSSSKCKQSAVKDHDPVLATCAPEWPLNFMPEEDASVPSVRPPQIQLPENDQSALHMEMLNSNSFSQTWDDLMYNHALQIPVFNSQLTNIQEEIPQMQAYCDNNDFVTFEPLNEHW